MAERAQTSGLLKRLNELEPNELEPAVALYSDCLAVFGRAPSGKPRIPDDILSMLMRKFEDPAELVKRCNELADAPDA